MVADLTENVTNNAGGDPAFDCSGRLGAQQACR
jgi:hypothetical protein